MTVTNPGNVSSEATVRLKIVASAAQQTHHEAAQAVKSFILSLHIMRVQCYSALESPKTQYAHSLLMYKYFVSFHLLIYLYFF